MDLLNIKEKIEFYLQNQCSDFWTVRQVKDAFECCFQGSSRFTLKQDEDKDWFVSGSYVDLEILNGICKILDV